MAKVKTGSLFQRGKVWYLVLSRVDGKRKWISLKTEKKAEAMVRAAAISGTLNAATGEEEWLLHLVELGKWAEKRLKGQRADSVPLVGLWPRWSEGRERREIFRVYEGYIRRLLGWCEKKGISESGDLTAGMASDYRDFVLGLQLGTAGREFVFFRRLWSDLELGNVWENIKAQKTGGGRYRRLKVEEVQAVVEHVLPIRRDVAILVLLGYCTGARLKTLRSLRVEDVDGDFLQVLHTKTARSKPRRCLVPLVGDARRAVKELTGDRREGYLFPALAQGEKPDIMRTMFKDAGVMDNALGSASFHSLRATFISMMDEAGVSPHLTDAITGHAPQGMHGRYTQPSRKALMEAVRVVIQTLEMFS